MNPQIYEWQKTILPDQSSEEVIGIAKVFSDCSDLWGVVINILAQQRWIQKNTIRKLESAHSYIRLWADGYGVPSGQFEERLRNSQRAGDLTIRLLQSICRTLTQELTPVVTGISTVASQDATGLSLTAAGLALSSERLAVLVQGDNDSEASEDGESVTPSGPASHAKLLDDIADDLRNDTQCLLDLGARFEEQVMNPIASEAAANPLNSFDGGLADTFIERIIRLYPRCEINLAGRIGKANRLRFLRIAELKPRMSEGRVIQDRDTDIIHDTTESEPVEFKSIVDIASTREKSLFHDSGLGTASHVSGSHPNAVQTVPENRGCPPLPEGAVQGEPFRCMACKNQVTMANEKEWRAHLLRDIEPYVCPEPDCDAPLFTSTSQWEKHVDSRHPQSTIWSDSRCRICGKAASNRAMVIRHLVDHMEAIALAIIPQGPGIEVDKASVNDTHEESERLTTSSKQEYKKTLQTASPRVKTGCNTCKMRWIKCDGKKPSCENCTKNKVVCDGYPPPPRSREAGADSKFELPSPPGQTDDSILEIATRQYSSEEWFPTLSDTATPAFVPVDDCFESVLGTQDELQDPSLDSAFVKPPLPTSTHRRSSDLTNTMHPITSRDSFAPHRNVDPDWDNRTALGGLDSDAGCSLFSSRESSVTVNDTTRTHRQPGDTTRIISPTHGVLPRRRDKPLPPIVVDDSNDTIAMKRVRNTLAARKSRERKTQRLEELEEKIAKLEQEREYWKNVAITHGAERS
ncbi:hypothetical protein F5B21DRAFT_488118 [Xylaria acuta]|nr:hypothetical protein F5B21DRAFT_488118 [Xylaria acuta]